MCLIEKINKLLDDGYNVKFSRWYLSEEDIRLKCIKITVSDGMFRVDYMLPKYELQNYKLEEDEMISGILEYLVGEIKSRRRYEHDSD